MRNEAPNVLPTLGFIMTGLLAARLVLLHNLKLYRATRKLKKAYSETGVQWSYMTDYKLRLKLWIGKESILDPDDGEKVVEAKKDLIQWRAELNNNLIKGVIIMLLGFFCSIILSIAENYIRHTL